MNTHTIPKYCIIPIEYQELQDFVSILTDNKIKIIPKQSQQLIGLSPAKTTAHELYEVLSSAYPPHERVHNIMAVIDCETGYTSHRIIIERTDV